MSPKSSLAWLFPLAFLFSALFWEAYSGVNLLIYHTCIFSVLRYLYAEAFTHRNVRIAMVGTTISALMVVVHGTVTAQMAYLGSLLVWVGFIKAPEMRSVFFVLPQSIFAYYVDQYEGIIRLSKLPSKWPSTRRALGWLKLSLVPLGVLTVFFWLYRAANPRFAALTDELLWQLGAWQTWLLSHWSAAWWWFWGLGLTISAWLLMRQRVESLVRFEQGKAETLSRRQRPRKQDALQVATPSMMALRSEWRMGLLTIGAVNLLLFAVNVVDIHWLWFTFDYQPEMNLSQLVHEGTYLLIFSILLSMSIILWFFRGNINFYKNKKRLQALAYLWIAQNLLLSFNVLMRNAYYIHYHGFTHKRIGVIIFLILVAFGLFSLVIKLHRVKSFFYLLKVNSWAALTMLVMLSTVNWDRFIAYYNLTYYHDAAVGSTSYLLRLSDDNLPLLWRNAHRMDDAENLLTYRTEQYIRWYERQDWRSWNWTDWYAYRQLKQREKQD